MGARVATDPGGRGRSGQRARWRRAALAALALLAPGAIAAPARARVVDVDVDEPAETIAARARQVLADERFQREHPPPLAPGASAPFDGLPGAGNGAGPERGARPPGDPRDPPGRGDVSSGAPAGEDAAPAPAPRSSSSSRSPTSQLVGTLLVALLIAAILGALAYGIARLLGRRPAPQAAAAPAPEGPRPERAPPEESAIEALAQAGRFAEAIHAMLELAVAQLGRRGCLALSEDMTGREALQRAEIDPAGRRALGELVLAVEVSLFGGRALGREDHERCAAALRRLASPGPAAGAGDDGGAA